MSQTETPHANTAALLRDRLQTLSPSLLEIHDDSHLHAGHAGAREGAHFRITVVSAQFSGQNTVARHRQVFAAVGDLMRGKIHALAISAKTPEEV